MSRPTSPQLWAAALLLILNARDTTGQTVSSKPPLAFAAASIKRSEPGALAPIVGPLRGGQTYIARNASVRLILEVVYGLIDDQISRGPEWIDTEHYDIEARAEKPSGLPQLDLMFQNLLLTRFDLKFHRETKQGSVYVLSVDKSGPKLRINDHADVLNAHVGPNVGSLPGMIAEGIDMPALCRNLAIVLRRPVRDETGLTGYYDFRLQWAPILPFAPPADGNDGPPASLDGPSIFSALREQLGLELQAKKGPVDVFVIDHIEKPSPN